MSRVVIKGCNTLLIVDNKTPVEDADKKILGSFWIEVSHQDSL